jgi:hypothetical protein
VLRALALFLSCTVAHFNTGSADIWLFLWTVVPDQLGVLPGPLAGYPPAGAHAVELAGLAVLAGIVALAVTAGRARVRGWLNRGCAAQGIPGRPLGGSSGLGVLRTCQVLPFHCSATWDTVVPGTATQNEAVAHDRAWSVPVGGAFTARQVLPFQASALVSPTAMQNEPLTHETPSRLSWVAGPVALNAGAAARSAAQADPTTPDGPPPRRPRHPRRPRPSYRGTELYQRWARDT